MLDALGKEAKLPKMVKLLDQEARNAAVKALTDKMKQLAGTSTGEAPPPERASGPAGGACMGDTDSETECDEELAQWGARRELLGGAGGRTERNSPPPAVFPAGNSE